MKIALDTNRYTDFMAGEKVVHELLSLAEEVGVPLVVVAELRSGFARGTKQKQNEDILLRFLAQPWVKVLMPTLETTFLYAELERDLQRRGSPIPTNDLWIAALSMQYGMHLYTRDKHFDRLPQLPRA